MCPGLTWSAAGGKTAIEEQKRAAVSVQPETETGTAAVAAEGPEEGTYSFAAMEARWPQVWEDLKVFTPADDGAGRSRAGAP